MSWRQQLLAGSDFDAIKTEEQAARAGILERANRLADFRRSHDAFLSSRNSPARALTVIENRVSNVLYEDWAQHRGEPGVPSNDEARKRLIMAALEGSEEYRHIREQCLQAEWELANLQEAYEDVRRQRNALLVAWWQRIVVLAPDIDLGEIIVGG